MNISVFKVSTASIIAAMCSISVFIIYFLCIIRSQVSFHRRSRT